MYPGKILRLIPLQPHQLGQRPQRSRRISGKFYNFIQVTFL